MTDLRILRHAVLLHSYSSMTMEDLCKAYARKRMGAIAAALKPEPVKQPADGKQARVVRHTALS